MTMNGKSLKKRVFKLLLSALFVLFAVILIGGAVLYDLVQNPRYRIVLEQKENESDLKVELMSGAELVVNCNHRSFMDAEFIEKRNRFGRSRYRFHTTGIMSTLKGCGPECFRGFEFFYMSKIIPYNSRRPIVVFVPFCPHFLEVRYRIIWQDGTRSEIRYANRR